MLGIITKISEKGAIFLTSCSKDSYDYVLLHKAPPPNVLAMSRLFDYSEKQVTKFVAMKLINKDKYVKRKELLKSLASYTNLEVEEILTEEFPKYVDYLYTDLGFNSPASSFHSAVSRIACTDYIILKNINRDASNSNTELFKIGQIIQYKTEEILFIEWNFDKFQKQEIIGIIY